MTAIAPDLQRYKTTFVAGPRSQAFDDLDAAGERPIVGLHSINVWVDRVVSGIQCVYRLANGKTFRAPVRGTNKGKKTRITLAEDEVLIQLVGRSNSGSITDLSLLTTRPNGESRLHGPFGGGEVVTRKKGKVVSYRTREMVLGGSDDGFSFYGQHAVALFGHARGGRLNGLGVYAAPLVQRAPDVRSTSALSEELRERKSGSRGQKKLESTPVFRTTVTVPEGTKKVTLWAEEQLRVEINGRARVLDRAKPTVVSPNTLSQITISAEAKDLAVPAIRLRTDRATNPWAWTTVYPDAAAHTKMAEWDADTLYNNRKALGISSDFSRDDCAAVQTAVGNIARAGLPTDEGHERKVDGKNMDGANWVLDLNDPKAGFSTVGRSQANAVKKTANRTSRAGAASGINVGKKLRKARKKTKRTVSKVVVETKKAAPKKVVKAAEKTGRNVAKSARRVGRELEDGDVLGAGAELAKGSLRLGRDVKTLGARTVVTVINAAGDAVEWVVDRSIAVGKLIWTVLEDIGVALVKLIKFLIDAIPWKAIGRTQKQLVGTIEAALGTIADADSDAVLEHVERIFDVARKHGEGALDRLTRALGGKVQTPKSVRTLGSKVGPKAQRALKTGGKALGKIQKIIQVPLEALSWLINKLVEKLPFVKKLQQAFAKLTKPLNKVFEQLLGTLGQAAKALPDSLGAVLANLGAIAKDPQRAHVLLLCALLQLVKGLTGASIEVVRGIVKALVPALKKVVSIVRSIGRLDLIPGKKARGGAPFFTKIFNFVVSGKTTLFNIVTFLLAVPVTMVNLAVTGKAPRLRRASRGNDVDKTIALSAGVIGFCEILIEAGLDAAEIARGVPFRYGDLQNAPVEQDETVISRRNTRGGDVPEGTVLKRGWWEVPAEVISWICAVASLGLAIPDHRKPSGRKAQEAWLLALSLWWLEAIMLVIDFVTMVWPGGTHSRLARWDKQGLLASRRAGSVASCLLTAIHMALLAYDQKNEKDPLMITANLTPPVVGLFRGGVMFFVSDPGPKKAIALGIVEAALGTAAVSYGVYKDVK